MASAQEANAKTTDQYSQASRPSATEKEKGVQQQQTAGESKDAQNFNPFQVQEEAKEAAKEAFVAQQEAQEVIKRAYTKQLKAQDKARRAAEQLFAQQEGGKQAAALAARQAATTAVEEQKSDAQKQMEQAVITAQVLGAQIAEQTVASDQSSASARLNPRGNVPQPSSVPSFQQPGGLTMEQQEMFGLANQMASAAVSQMSVAQSLASSTQDPQALLGAKSQADVAQAQMVQAQQAAQAAQTPVTAVQALTSIRQSSQQSDQANEYVFGETERQSTQPMQVE